MISNAFSLGLEKKYSNLWRSSSNDLLLLLCFQTRKIVAALLQHISYNEYLAAFLSDETMRKYNLKSKVKGYDDTYNPKVNPTITNVLSTAAFRYAYLLADFNILELEY